MSLALIISTALLTASFNPPEYLHPGVYVEEVTAGVKPVEGVTTSTCVAGITTRGPRAGRARLVEDRELMRRFRGDRDGRNQRSDCGAEATARRTGVRVERSRFGAYAIPH